MIKNISTLKNKEIIIILLFIFIFLPSCLKEKKKVLHYKNGNKKATGYIENGLKKGIWEYWYETGERLCKGIYLNNNKNGYWIYWDKSGNKVLDGFYINDKKHGIWNSYGINEELVEKVNYWNGIPSGLFISYGDSIKRIGTIENSKIQNKIIIINLKKDSLYFKYITPYLKKNIFYDYLDTIVK